MKINWEKIIRIFVVVFATAFVTTSIVAGKKKGDSTYKNDAEQKNLMAGKKVIFVENDEEPENADGVKGHLEGVGDTEYKESFYEKHVKRAIDVILSFGGLVMFAPVLAGIAIAIKIDDPSPVLFTQKRVGKNKEYFKLHKFRSMKMSTPHDTPTHMLENPERRITKVGKFLRAHSLDGCDIIGQPRKCLENKGFREVSPMNFIDNHTRFGRYSGYMRIATV